MNRRFVRAVFGEETRRILAPAHDYCIQVVPVTSRHRWQLAMLKALAFLWIAAACCSALAQGKTAPLLDSFLPKLDASELIQGATRFGAVQGSPPVAAVFQGSGRVGFAYLTSDVVDTRGYSGKPIHTVVALDNDGTIVGLRIVEHSEPILMVGVPERRIAESLRTYIGFNPLRASAASSGPPKADVVSGATVTVLIIGDAIVRSATRVARALRSGGAVQAAGVPPATGAAGSPAPGPAGAVAPPGTAPAPRTPARVVDPDAGRVADWKSLRSRGAIAHLRVTVGEVNRAFEESGDAVAATLRQGGAADDAFIDLYATLVSQPAIAGSLLDAAESAELQRRLAPGQQALLIAASGAYSFKGTAWLRGGIFDRIALVQGLETIRFWDRHHLRIGRIIAGDAPDLREIGAFAIPEGAEFDPTAPWQLQLIVQRSTGNFTQAFVSFELPYRLPELYSKPGVRQPTGAAGAGSAAAGSAAAGSAAAGAGPTTAAPATAGTQPPATTQAQSTTAATATAPSADPPRTQAADATGAPRAEAAAEEIDPPPLWRRVWESRIAAIVVLLLMLGVLTAVFYFQNLIVPHEKLFDRLRLAFLAVTLIWLGWVAQAQLSVVNVLTFMNSVRTDFRWESFLVDPLIFILWGSVAAALLLWGRGPFCGWLCPFGALQELSNRAAKALKVPQLKVPWGVHERLWSIKYIVFLVLFGVSLGSLALAERLSEIEPFKTAIVLRFMREWWFVLFALSLLAVGLFVERFFCRYLCPLGAALSIPGRLRMFDWLRRYRECGNPCMRCFNECPVDAIHPEGHIDANECISCMHCQVLYNHDTKCPVRVQRRLRREKRQATAPAGLAAGVAVTVHRRARGAE